MKKRIMALICSFTLAAALTGCGSSGAGNETAKQPPAAEDSETETAAETGRETVMGTDRAAETAPAAEEEQAAAMPHMIMSAFPMQREMTHP